jgi:hypothetical protein
VGPALSKVHIVGRLRRSLVKMVSRLAVVGVLAAGGVLAAAAPAAALPGCTVNRLQTGPFTEGAEVRCTTSGTFKVRVVIDCHELLTGADITTFGPWIAVPGVSSASCTVGRFLTDYYAEAIG